MRHPPFITLERISNAGRKTKTEASTRAKSPKKGKNVGIDLLKLKILMFYKNDLVV